MMAHSALKTSQAAALVVPPIYILSSLVRRRGLGFSISGLLRASTRGVVLGAPVGAVAAWGRLRNEPLEAVEDRCFRLVSGMGGCRRRVSARRGRGSGRVTGKKLEATRQIDKGQPQWSS